MGKKRKERIRVIALGIVSQVVGAQKYIFVGENTDETTGNVFYRAIGGGIDFGEWGQDAFTREFTEETKLIIEQVSYIGTLQNIFTYQGVAGHEIALIYHGRFANKECYALDFTVHAHDDGAELFIGRWMPFETFFGDEAHSLYPDGLPDLLRKFIATSVSGDVR